MQKLDALMRIPAICIILANTKLKTEEKRMNIIAIDPGNRESAFVIYRPETMQIVEFGKRDNEILVPFLKGWSCIDDTFLAVEMIKSFGNAMGDEVLETCVWIGRFIEAWNNEFYVKINRKTIVSVLCHNSRAGDSAVRQAVIDRFREAFGYDSSRKAIGNKKNPGRLYGVSADVWSALAVALVFAEMKGLERTRVDK